MDSMKTFKSILAGLAVLFSVSGAFAVENVATARDSVSVGVERGRVTDAVMDIVGVYDIEVVRDGVAIHNFRQHNLVTLQGKRYLLDAALANSAGGFAEQTAWYVALVSTNTAASAAYVYDTFLDGATIPATEFVSYSGGVRKTWSGVLDATAASITNSASRASFACTGGGTIYGAALVSLDTLSDHTAGDYVISYATFASPITVVNGDTVNVTVTLTLN
jgi:hypothetical protein